MMFSLRRIDLSLCPTNLFHLCELSYFNNSAFEVAGGEGLCVLRATCTGGWPHAGRHSRASLTWHRFLALWASRATACLRDPGYSAGFRQRRFAFAQCE
jgi:hypothetical protein